MDGSKAKMLNYLEGADKRYQIPVYQRKYDWKHEHCQQLYEDLKKINRDNRESHFFGSIVSSVIAKGNIIEYHIIDGQQRITTISLLLLAIKNLIEKGLLSSKEEKLNEQISQRFLLSPWANEDDKIKLRPVQSDRIALTKLYGDEEDYERSSNLTINYQYFVDMLLKEEISVDDIYSAIGKLEIISITLDEKDNAQLIFESLNSTGLALEEGDKIRNYILMGLDPSSQQRLYKDYWLKIESCTSGQVSDYIRDYLSIKLQSTPNINSVYSVFKKYALDSQMPTEELLKDLLDYARYFEKILTCRSGFDSKELDDCLYRIKRLEIVVPRPFFMEVFRLEHDKKISKDDVKAVFFVTENYLFRRNICEVPTNALNKIFVTLNKEIIRFDNTANNYVDKLIYALEAKQESGRFPNDDEFIEELSVKQIYKMRGRYKAYLFERFENYGTVEVKDVYTHLDNNVYTIEHIMPQHLTQDWIEALGTNYDEIHSTWLHRLANLTLTGYNPNLSNKSFLEKRDSEEGGYRISGIRMNQRITEFDKWGEEELKLRNKEMIEKAVAIWSYPHTDYVPEETEYDSCSLDDEDIDLTRRDLVKYSYNGLEYPVSSWADMFEEIVKYHHEQDRSVLTSIAYNTSSSDLNNCISNKSDVLRYPLQIAEDIYIEKNTSTAYKMVILRRLFSLYGSDPMNLVFYLKDNTKDLITDAGRKEIRKKYWTFALPIIQKENVHRGTFGNCSPNTSNLIAGSFGIGGFSVQCVSNYDQARIDFGLASNSKEKNKEAYDLLYSHRREIEDLLDTNLEWTRSDEMKASWISLQLLNVSIANETDWPRMARFHAEWSNKICDAFLPYLQDKYGYSGLPESEKEQLQSIAIRLKEIAETDDRIVTDLTKCNRTYIRFKTNTMSSIMPDEGGMSGWNTTNHYFYEFVNRTGNSFYIQLAISSKNLSDRQKELIDRINKMYPTKYDKADWQWRTPYRTKRYNFNDLSELEKLVNKAIEEMLNFEKQLLLRLNDNSNNR